MVDWNNGVSFFNGRLDGAWAMVSEYARSKHYSIKYWIK